MAGPPPPPPGRLAGTAKVGEKGQIVIPKKARDIFDLHPGDQLLVLGEEQQGIALVKASQLQQFATDILKAMRGESEE